MELNHQDKWFIYILECSDSSYYCGITTNIERRLKQHLGEMKGGAKYTHSRKPCYLVYQEQTSSRKDALKREIEIKKMTKSEKIKLIHT